MGIFDNVESVVINGHEVQSIIDSNGGVLYERQSGDNYLLTLTSDKDILSYYDDDTCIITASLTNWGEPLEGENVVFSCDDPIETIEVSSSGIYDLGEYCIINCAELPINPRGSAQKIVIGDTDNFLYIWKSQEDKLTILKNNIGWSGFNDDIVIKNGVLKAYQEEYQKYQTLDVSDVDLTKWTLITTNSVVIPVEKYFYETAVTDSNGEASVTYESKGMGDLNIKACVPGRMLVSEICEVLDCSFYDVGISETGTCSNTNWGNYNNAQTVSCNSTGKTVSRASGGNGFYSANTKDPNATPFPFGFVLECEIVSASSVRLQLMGINQMIALTDGDKVKIECKDGKMIETVNDVVSSPVSVTETNVGIRFLMMGKSSVTFKNFKVYPI